MDCKRLSNYIDGKFIAPKNKQYLENYNPSTGEVYSYLPDSSAEDIDLAVDAAVKAFSEWRYVSAEERAEYLLKIGNAIETRARELAEAESMDQGKTVVRALELELPRAIKNFRFFANSILQQKTIAADMDRAFNYVVRAPIGVAGLISPWNLPLYLLTWKIAPALAMGNTAVCKPSEVTPYTAYLLAEILSEVCLPPGVCNIVFGRGETAGSRLVKHPKVKLISFTGGTETGKIIAQDAAPYFKKLSFELGGKNAALVFADADLESNLETIVRSSFSNQGEICLCSSRVYVEEKIYDDFLKKFVAATRKLKVGDPRSQTTFVGPVVSQEHREKILEYIRLAQSEGGTLHCGGKIPNVEDKLKNGYFLEPTVITGIRLNSRLTQEEIFGPVVILDSFRDEKEAIQKANATAYGLSGTIWTGNLHRAHSLAREMECGTVWINTWMERDLRVPFGGSKLSGLGREGGEYSLDFYSEIKNICIKSEVPMYLK